MPSEGLPELYGTIDALLEGGDLDEARARLQEPAAASDTFAVLRIKLGLLDGSLEPGHAMQRLIQLMRRDADWPGAKELYQHASQSAYQSGRSSVSHSHPPPPPMRKGHDSED